MLSIAILVVWTLGICVIAAYGIYQFVVGFRNAKGTLWERALCGAHGSATLLWARFVFICSALFEALANLADLLGAPEVSAAIGQYGSPKVVAVLMIAIPMITEIARRRQDNGRPVPPLKLMS